MNLKATPAPSADVASNPLPASSTRAFVFVVDDGTIEPQHIIPLKRVMTEFLQQLSPDDRVAIVYVKRSDLAQDFTTDIGRLVRAANNLSQSVGWEPDARATRLTLDNIVSALAAAPEARRAVVYVSGGHRTCEDVLPPQGYFRGMDCVPLTGGGPIFFAQSGMQDLFTRARNADVSIYTLDPNGLRAPELGLEGHLEDQTPQHRASLDIRNRAQQDFLRTVAENTGGLALVNTNDLPRAADIIMRDNGTYYLIGYSPSPYVADEKFHDVDVKITTRPGLHVRARKGYVASKPAAALEPNARLLAAVGDVQPRSDLPLRAFAAPVAPKANGATAVVTLDVTYPEAPSGATRPDDDLDVAFVAIDSEGKVRKSEPRSLHVQLGAPAGGTSTVSLDDSLDLPKGKWTLRIGVSSQALGTIGTVHLPIAVPAFSGGSLELSPIVLGLAGKTTDLVGRPEAISALIPFQPTTRRTFAASETLKLFSRVFAPRPADVKIELHVKRGDSTVRTVPIVLTAAPSLPSARDCVPTLPLTDLEPGDYALELVARQGHDQVKTAIAVTVR